MNELKQAPLQYIITTETCLRMDIHKNYKRRNDLFWRNILKDQIKALRFSMDNFIYSRPVK